MKLSSETVLGLKRLCNVSLVNERNFESLVASHSRLIDGDGSVDKVVDDGNGSVGVEDDSKLDVFKSSYAAVITLFAEASRHNVDSFVLKTILEGYNLNANRISYIVHEYQLNKESVRKCLAKIGTNSPHILGVRWRLDYRIRSERNYRILEPLYLVEIVVRTSLDTERVIRFACLQQNLQQLVSLLKSVVKHMKRTTTNVLR